ncbi:O-antigen ligase family protein [Pseudomonas sp. dw_358]|uniref:O-antigen ligase family protein n=1 Tax=Pseudomonas sp. dw_358 TaxID=2720083 RepID=UPI001BD4C130|nr:O-antigen ligase family protein [Pseudomonas sp. dw_358]
MGTGVSTLTTRHRLSEFFQDYLIPLGWVVILISMFIAGDRGRVHQLFYIFLALPTVILLTLRPRLLKPLVCNPLFAAIALFCAYTILTVAWSSTDDTALSLARRPLYVALLLFAAGIIGMRSVQRLTDLTRLAAIIAALTAAISLVYFLTVRMPQGSPRLDGYGALYNPLLSAHVFGAFATFWLATWLQGRKLNNPMALVCLAILLATLLATGSRTPLVGLAFALCWLVIVGDRRRGLIVVGAIALALVLVVACYPASLAQRGVSYRPQIWLEALRQISQHPWFGHGFDSGMTVLIPGLDQILADPHNIELGVLYTGGIVGLVLWLAVYAVAMRFCWQNRHVPMVSLAAAWLLFGFGSGLTEGMAFMSRPKEHWFLIWIPMALIFALWVAQRKRGNAHSL